MKRIISYLLACLLLALAVFPAVSCGSVTPYSLWSNAEREIQEAEFIGADIDIEYAGVKAAINAEHNIKDGSRKLALTLREERKINIYSDGETNYYEDIEGESNFCYSSPAEEDSPIMKELLSIALLKSEDGKLTKKDFEAVEAVKNDDGGITFSLSPSSDVFKRAFAPDEDAEFSSVTMKAEFDREEQLISLKINCEISGSELYGIPLFAGEKEALELSVTKIDYKSAQRDIVPEKLSDYTSLPAFSRVSAAALMLELKQESHITIDGEIVMSMDAMKMPIPLEGSVISALSEGYQTSRTRLSVNIPDIFGNFPNTEIDIFTDGKSDYTYYTFKNGDNYKVKNEAGEGFNPGESIEELSDPETAKEFFKNAIFMREGKETAISFTIGQKMLEGLISESSEGEQIDVAQVFENLRDVNIGVTIYFDDSGAMTKAVANINAKVLYDVGTEKQTMTVKATINAELSDLMQDVKPSVPKDYELYEELNGGVDDYTEYDFE